MNAENPETVVSYYVFLAATLFVNLMFTAVRFIYIMCGIA